MKNLLIIQNSKVKILLSFLLIHIQLLISNTVFPPNYINFIEDFDCDACGCSNVGGSLNMGGVIDNNFIGLRYLHQQYQSKDGIFEDSSEIQEYFNTLQIWSRIPINDRFEIQTFIPFHYHNRVYEDNSEKIIKGLGDISLISNYTVIDTKKFDINVTTEKISTINHLVKIGLGIKIPTGSYNQSINNSINPSFQLGTGSLDYITSLQYVFKYNKLGTSTYLNYFYKNKNKKEYSFGNQTNISTTIFYVFHDKKKNSIVPSLSFSGEFYESNRLYGLEITNSKGKAFLASVGIEYNSKKLTLGISTMYPINQKLAQGTVKIQHRSSLYINYNL